MNRALESLHCSNVDSRRRCRGEIIEGLPQFHACKAAAGNHEGQQAFRAFGSSTSIGSFQHFDNVTANGDGIEQRLKSEGVPLNAFETEILRDGAQRQHEVIVRKRCVTADTTRRSKSTPVTRARKNVVRCSAVRVGLLMCAGSRLLPATSASIGVKRRAFVSLTSVSSISGSKA